MHEPLTNLRKVLVLVMERDTPPTEVWRALYGAAALHRAAGKYVIAVNDDIDPDNADALLWAMSYRANPALDIEILPHRDQGHGPRSKRNGGEDAIGADRRDAQGELSAGVAAQARIHGARAGDLGGAGPAAAEARGAVVRLFAGRVGRRARRGGGSVRSRAIISRPAPSMAKRRRNDVRINTEVRDLGTSWPKNK